MLSVRFVALATYFSWFFLEDLFTAKIWRPAIQTDAMLGIVIAQQEVCASEVYVAGHLRMSQVLQHPG